MNNTNFYPDPTNSDIPPDTSNVPGYLVAADNHNIGNTRGGSWFDPSTYQDKFANLGQLIATGMLSGANSFYNTGITVGNWMGASETENDTKEWISGIDSDLGVYYSKNRAAADLVGFIAGSLIPGLGGIKVLNAGQTALRAAKAGMIGENLSVATGLLIPQTERYIALAAKDINAATATFSSINANGVKALASGVWQNTLEAAAFETAVQATMFKSPILDHQDGWDIAKNIAIGGAIGGVVGGAFSAAFSLGKIKKLVGMEEAALKNFSARDIPGSSLSPANKIILMAEDRDSAIATMLAYGTDTPLSTNFDVASKLHLDKLRRINNDIRTETHAMIAGADSELGNMVADTLVNAPHTITLNNLLHTEEIGRVGVLSKIEKEANKAAKDGKIVTDLDTSYLKLIGEDVGTVSATEPTVLNIADKVIRKAGQSSEDAVLNVVRDKGFKLLKPWSAVDVSGVTGHFDAEARYIWADKVLKEIPDNTRINQYDIPVLERALKDSQLTIQLTGKDGAILQKGFSSKNDLFQYIVDTKELVANELLRTHVLDGIIPVEQGTQAIAKIVNTKLSQLEGTGSSNPAKDYFARQAANEEYLASLKVRNIETPAGDPTYLPTVAKISRRTAAMADINGNIVDGLTWIKQLQRQTKLAIDNVFAKAAGPLSANVPEITQSALYTANRYGAGAGMWSFANGSYGSLESTAQLLGSITNSLKKSYRQITADLMQGPLSAMGTKLDAAIEFETINQKVTRSANQWVLDAEGITGEVNALVRKDIYAGLKDGTIELEGGLEGIIPIVNTETVDLIRTHIQRSGVRTQTYRELRAAQGLQDVKDPEVFRPIRPSTSDYPFFAFVRDPSVTGQGHMTMIHAADEASLKGLIDKVPSQYQVLTKKDTEEFFAARHEYDYQRTLHESMIDSNLKNNGVFSNFFAKTDPQKIVNDILNQHLREDDILAIELMRAKNQNAFNFLEDQGKAYTKIEASKFGNYTAKMEASAKNPYLDYIKTSLDISKVSEHPLVYGFNKFLDTAVSRGVGAINAVFNKSRSVEELESINQILSSYGMNTGYRDAALDLLANHQAPKGELTKFIRGANAILSKLTLGLDPLNAINNFVGANILRSTELKQITDAIRTGNSSISGELGKLLSIKLPGVSDSIISPTKLVQQAMTNFVKDDGTLLARYKELGVIKDASAQFKNILEDFTLRGTETVSELSSRLNSAYKTAKNISETGEKLTGNKFAEEFNRFISADAMRQITDIGIKAGILTSKEQAAYINTFVNRVEGNVIASQRPLMFQGPIGQAIGLFQSYQFNLMQQMFRYVAEGTAKDSAMLLGLQGTFFGIQGLPAFQFINQHVVGNMSGNQKHVDLYDSIYGIAGQQFGDFALYGLPSNLLQANLYSRGDINPRQVTVIPTTLPDIPIVGAFGKFLGSVKDTVSKMANGANVWESMLQGLEHNGLSRPLAGLAQTLQSTTGNGVPFSTTTQGSILFSNDLMSWATAVRLAGGRPLDEAIINDGVFRIQAYQQSDTAKMNMLGRAIKASSINGQMIDGEQLGTFAEKYASYGGKQLQFNRYIMNEFKAANTSQSQKIVSQLQNPFAQKMQILMGGGSDVTPLSYLSQPSQ